MKNTFIISCPIDTYSGYGARSRDLVKAIIETDKYNVKILSQRWGNTPFGFIEDNFEQWGFLKPHLLPQNYPISFQPDIWMQITVPNEFQPVGKYNIGVTAGIETTICHPSWIEGVNRMNLTLVSSNHAKKVFQDCTFEVRDNNNSPARVIKLEKPIEVLFEGADTNIYKILKKEETKKTIDLDSIKESFCYLFVGHWLPGHLGEDRKNVGLLIKAFYETFKNKKDAPALILKTSCVGVSYMDRREILHRINQIKSSIKANSLPKVYLLHGEFSDEEMNELYNHSKIKAMVSLTKGEGFGRPLLEFSLTNKPIITSNWSGHLDFLSPEFTTLVNGDLGNVHQSATQEGIILPEAQWFNPNLAEVNYHFKNVFDNYKSFLELAKRQGYKNRNEFTWDKMKEKVDVLFTQYIPDLPKQVQLKLPQLKKIELPKLKKIEENVG
jgi:hypothetical protein